ESADESADESAQLAVLAAAAVVAAAGTLAGVALFLAGQAQAHARQRLPPGLGDGLPAFLAITTAGTGRQLAARPLDGVLHRCVDLVLDGAVAGPTGGHALSSCVGRGFYPGPATNSPRTGPRRSSALAPRRRSRPKARHQ